MSDWLPRRRGRQLEMAKLWVKELPAAADAWNVTPLEISELTDLAQDAQNALDRLGAGGTGTVNTAKAREASRR